MKITYDILGRLKTQAAGLSLLSKVSQQ